MSKVIENRLISEFKVRESFTREELFSFYRSFEPNLNEGTFGWRIYDLKNRNIIKPLKRGLYIISHKTNFRPLISNDLIKLAKRITDRYKDITYCIWDTAWLNEFTQHQTSKSIIVIEIEKGFEESLFYHIKDTSRREVFLNPDEKDIELYIAESNHPIVIKNLLTRAPITKRTEKKVKLYAPTLEKILVDLFSEEKLYYFLQRSELIHIYESAINSYAINFTKMLSYAGRRKRDQNIRQFLTNHMYHLVKDFIHD
ncbi:MAG: DUF6577 family protein [Bacteroidota bacterium]